VKVLDFGVAAMAQTLSGDSTVSRTLTISATQAGTILGTPAYMSPEQARGRTVDKRTDIWAFGCVWYEMLTGKRAFDGESMTDVLAAVVNSEPDWAALPAGSPVRLLRRCMEKDPRRRLRDIGDALAEAEAEPVVRPVAATPEPRRRWPVWVLLAVVVLSSGAAVSSWLRFPPSKEVSRLSIALPPNQEVTDQPAISADGHMIAYVAQEGSGEPRLYLRSLQSFDAREVEGASGAVSPFFSPDGKWVAFFAKGQLMKAAVGGGSPVKLAPATFPFGGTWGDDDIVYVPENVSGLWRISPAGGAPEAITKADGGANGHAHVWPQWLPGTRSVLFTVWGKDVIGSAVLSLDTRKWQVVLPKARQAVFAPSVGSSGWLLVTDPAGGVKAGRLDAAHPAPTSADTPVLSEAYYRVESLEPWMAVSRTGTAVYVPGSVAKRSLVWVDRTGRIEPASREQCAFWQAALSPDGTRALAMCGADLWLYDFSTGGRRRITFNGDNGALVSSPMWSHDGARIFFASNEGGDIDIYSQPADGSQPAEVFLKRADQQFPTSMAPDGTLLFGEGYVNRAEALFTVSPDGRVSPFKVTAFSNVNALFSPEGHWVAYQSDESGRYEVYVEAYPGGGRRQAVSVDGGIAPAWSRDGKELFYVSGDMVMAAGMRADGSFGPGRRLFDRAPFFFEWHSWDAAPDGKRFLMMHRDLGSVSRQLNVVVNWTADLERLAPRR